MNRNIRML